MQSLRQKRPSRFWEKRGDNRFLDFSFLVNIPQCNWPFQIKSNFFSLVLYCIRSQLLRLQQIIKRHQSYVIQRHALLVQLQISLRTLQQQHNKLIVMIHTHTFCLCTNFVVYNGNFAFYFCILLSLNFQFELMHEITIKVQTINFNSFSMKKNSISNHFNIHSIGNNDTFHRQEPRNFVVKCSNDFLQL